MNAHVPGSYRDPRHGSVVSHAEFSENKIRKRRRVLLLGAGYTTNNMGVWALASSAIKSAYYANSNVTINLLDYHTSPQTYDIPVGDRNARVELINIRFSKKLYRRDNIARLILTGLFLRIIPSQQLRERIIGGHPALAAICSSDTIGSIAGGDSFSDIYGLRRYIYVVLPQLLVLILRRPLILLPQTLGPFRSKIAKYITKFVIRKAEAVYARDRESMRIGLSFSEGDPEKIRLCCDMAFILDPQGPSGPKSDQIEALKGCRPLVGLNVSGLLCMGGYSRNNMFGLKVDYRALIRDIINYFTQAGCHVLLIPHVFGAVQGGESDIAAIEDVYADCADGATDRLHKLSGNFDHHEIKHVIGRCDFFLGSRMHACIAALSQSVPAIGLAYSRKFAGVFETIGAENLVVDLRSVACEAAIDQIASVFTQREAEKSKLLNQNTKARAEILKIFSLD